MKEEHAAINDPERKWIGHEGQLGVSKAGAAIVATTTARTVSRRASRVATRVPARPPKPMKARIAPISAEEAAPALRGDDDGEVQRVHDEVAPGTDRVPK